MLPANVKIQSNKSDEDEKFHKLREGRSWNIFPFQRNLLYQIHSLVSLKIVSSIFSKLLIAFFQALLQITPSTRGRKLMTAEVEGRGNQSMDLTHDGRIKNRGFSGSNVSQKGFLEVKWNEIFSRKPLSSIFYVITLKPMNHLS